jgi:hypothetical protein
MATISAERTVVFANKIFLLSFSAEAELKFPNG